MIPQKFVEKKLFFEKNFKKIPLAEMSEISQIKKLLTKITIPAISQRGKNGYGFSDIIDG
ncbi:MAG: hypothetical protein Q4D62_06525 [Planctomycetia bacterium]|nr:hypothetical protein [Planctomycetia bacterium]